MLSGVPNFAFTIGYTNASWTLKADLVDRVRRPAAAPHGRARPPPGRRRARPGRGRAAVHGLLAPATCSARSTRCRCRATGRPGCSSRTTSPTSAPSTATRIDDGVLTFRLTRRPVTASGTRRSEEADMGLKDKAENKVEDLKGQGKESAGKATGDRDLEAEGKADQAERQGQARRRARQGRRQGRQGRPDQVDAQRQRRIDAGRTGCVLYTCGSSPFRLASGSARLQSSRPAPFLSRIPSGETRQQ